MNPTLALAHGHGVATLDAARRWPAARVWRFALAAGFCCGLVSAATDAMFDPTHIVQRLVSNVVLAVSLALSGLVFATAADAVAARRTARWLAFTGAGILAGTMAYTLAHPVLGRLLPEIDVQRGFMPAWGRWTPTVLIGALAALGYMHWLDAAARSRALHALKLRRLRLAREAYEARLSALQAQIEPAFLFETLAEVQRLYDARSPLAARLLDALIVHLRAVLPTIDDVRSSFGVELALVESWLDIMRIRSGKDLVVAIACGDVPREARVPPMALLPLVQEAVRCGGGAEAVVVAGAVERDRLTISVVGAGAAFAPAHGADTVSRIRDCLATLYGDAAQLTLAPVARDRCQARLEIPYERTDRDPR